MADFSKFRSSLGGFNRSDVVNYIEASSLEHHKELRGLKESCEALTAENESLREQLAQVEAERTMLQAECEQLRAQLDQLREEDASLQEQIESLAQEASSLAEQVTEMTVEDFAGMELEAYRRAEAMERNASLRAERLSERMDALCESVRSRCQDSGDEVAALQADLSAVLERLKEAMADICVIFDETENELDELQLNQMLPTE